jgi:hypothetical protein
VETLVGLWTDLGRVSGVALSTPVYAAVSALHVVGMALLFGPIALVDLRVAGFLRSLDVAALTLLRATARIGAALAVPTGILLASARPDEYLANPTFLAKLAVVGLGARQCPRLRDRGAAHGASPPCSTRPAPAPAPSPPSALWLAAIGLGRWIAFT